MANIFEDTRVAEVGAVDAPGGGLALVVVFRKAVEVEGKEMVIPLEAEHVRSLFYILTGKVAEGKLQALESPLITPMQLDGLP